MEILKFRCKGCGKKMGVRPEHAGKRVKCQGCGEPVRVPTPRPERAQSGAPVAAGLQADGELSSPAKPAASKADKPASMDDLYALAAMESAAQAQTPTFEKGVRKLDDGRTQCPECGANTKPDAVICVGCGYNFKKNKKLKTKQSKEKDISVGKAAAGAGKAVLALVVASVVAVIFAVIWVVIAIVTERQFGYVAWIMGGLIGFIVAAISRRQSSGVGMAAAAVSFAAWALAKGIMLAIVLLVTGVSGMFDGLLAVPAVGEQMYQAQQLSPELAEYHEHFMNDTKVTNYGEAEDLRLYNQYEAAITQQMATMSDDQIEVAVDTYKRDHLGMESTAELDMGMAFLEVFGLLDLLWVLLMVSTAYKVAAGGQ